MVAAAKSKTHTKLAKADRGKFSPIPLLTKLKARNLYLIQNASHKEIAEQTGLTKHACEQLAYREGWVEVRREKTKRMVEKHDARMANAASEVLDSVVGGCEELAVSGLNRVRESLDDKSDFAARNFQSWTGGVKNLVSIMREIRAPSETTPTNAGLVAFVIRVGDDATPAAKSEVNVTPANTAIELQKL